MSLRTAIVRLQLPNRIVTAVTPTTRYLATGGPKSVGKPGSNSFVSPNLLRGWYNVFGKSTAGYTAWLVLVVLVGEYTFGGLTDSFWNNNNRSHTYLTTDWSKFDQFEDSEAAADDDEEEEEEEDDE